MSRYWSNTQSGQSTQAFQRAYPQVCFKQLLLSSVGCIWSLQSNWCFSPMMKKRLNLTKAYCPGLLSSLSAVYRPYLSVRTSKFVARTWPERTLWEQWGGVGGGNDQVFFSKRCLLAMIQTFSSCRFRWSFQLRNGWNQLKRLKRKCSRYHSCF